MSTWYEGGGRGFRGTSRSHAIQDPQQGRSRAYRGIRGVQPRRGHLRSRGAGRAGEARAPLYMVHSSAVLERVCENFPPEVRRVRLVRKEGRDVSN